MDDAQGDLSWGKQEWMREASIACNHTSDTGESMSRAQWELLKLHLKHYHMTTENFRRRTSALKLPEVIYEEYDKIGPKCESCQLYKPAPQRSRITGMRATNFGDLVSIDHVDLSVDKNMYLVLVAIDVFLINFSKVKNFSGIISLNFFSFLPPIKG